MGSALEDETGRTAVARPGVAEQVRGAVIEVLPIFCFTVGFAISHQVAIALPLALAAGIAACGYRLVRRESAWRALGALGIVALGGVLALRSGEATDFFLPNLVMHGAIGVVSIILLLAGWPVMGLVVGLLTRDRMAWRRCPIRRRGFTRGSLVLLASPLLMTSAGLPLYLADEAVALGTVDVFGPFVFALAAMVGWRVHRRTVGTHRCGDEPCSVPES
ncbi:DUF3159 domain-containing protein [Nonomuraea sp. NPDC049709]|uniref:DUF3159 domain-containing protein n=1 Tax=Nonomuraea sp. NPDC049709 TaxID=3154736 RepID=UPI003433B98C